MMVAPGSHLDGTAGGRVGKATFRWIKRFLDTWRHRRDLELLASFDDHMLADIGLTRADLHDAVAEPQWRDPTELLADRRHERRAGRHQGTADGATVARRRARHRDSDRDVNVGGQTATATW
jgi:uncharacterized protein YjiS (DUF1127 family)